MPQKCCPTISVTRLTRKTIRTFSSNKKGASQVLSLLILTAGVIAMSIAVLYWTYSMGKVGNAEYSKSTMASTNAVGERLNVEYMTYDGNSNLTAYVMNWGKSDNITIVHVLVLNSTGGYLGSAVGNGVTLKNIVTSQPIQGNALRIGQDAYFTAKLSVTLTPDELYYVRFVTSRGRNFDVSFTL